MKVGDIVYLGRERGVVRSVRLTNNGPRVHVKLDSSKRVTCIPGPYGYWIASPSSTNWPHQLFTEQQHQHSELKASVLELLKHTEALIEDGHFTHGGLEALKSALEKQ